MEKTNVSKKLSTGLMIKFIFVGLWLLVIAFGAVMVGHAMRGDPGIDAAPMVEEAMQIEQKSLDLISIPVMVSGKVDGYVLVKLTYMTEKKSNNGSAAMLAPFIMDEIYRQFFGAYSEASQIELVRIDAVREQIIAAVNQRFGQSILKDIMIEQFNYIRADQVRDKRCNAPEPTAA